MFPALSLTAISNEPTEIWCAHITHTQQYCQYNYKHGYDAEVFVLWPATGTTTTAKCELPSEALHKIQSDNSNTVKVKDR